MSKSRQIVVLGSLALALIVVAAWFLLLSPRMETTGEINAEREALEQQNAATLVAIGDLVQKRDNIATVVDEAADLSSRFPATAEESELFNLIRDAAAKAGIPENNISDLTTGVPVLGAASGSVSLPEAPAAEAPAADPNAAPAAGTAPVAPVESSAQLGNMSLDVTVAGSEEQILRFLAALEEMDRAYLVNSVALGRSEGAGMTATINGAMYLLPELRDPTQPLPVEASAEAEVPAP